MQPVYGNAYDYAYKTIRSTNVTFAVATASLERFRTINGSRLIHPSRGFWLDQRGQACRQRTAVIAAADMARGGPTPYRPLLKYQRGDGS